MKKKPKPKQKKSSKNPTKRAFQPNHRRVVVVKRCPTNKPKEKNKRGELAGDHNNRTNNPTTAPPATRRTSPWSAQVAKLNWPKRRKGLENPASMSAPQPAPT
jgi:hypothetical protein